MNAPPRIRQLNPADAEAWALLRWEALETHPLAFGASVPHERQLMVDLALERLASSEEAAIFGAFDDTMLVGIAGVRREAGEKERHKAFIWGMYVRAASRRHGTGNMLLGAAIEKARAWSGVEVVHLSVSEVANDARRIYERHGFREWGREPRALRWKGRSADETHMILDLRATGAG